jgi:hypothetical protein
MFIILSYKQQKNAEIIVKVGNGSLEPNYIMKLTQLIKKDEQNNASTKLCHGLQQKFQIKMKTNCFEMF